MFDEVIYAIYAYYLVVAAFSRLTKFVGVRFNIIIHDSDCDILYLIYNVKTSIVTRNDFSLKLIIQIWYSIFTFSFLINASCHCQLADIIESW